MKSDEALLLRILVEQADHNLHVTTTMLAMASRLEPALAEQLNDGLTELSASSGRFLNLVQSYIDKQQGS